ncbi:class I SAM-dependent methyltransferase [Cryobacterium luteum]|uniref:Class I SAM-dependent methyltransferase n=1 Tax=Cryobacterium luteum TaxID=1424661 RepID=A0A5F0D416_9MICO|nr:class I SAM-dependent methyltransferase [Cryobacterium luteum]TFB89389.1 class I SAM-dependent methyltransferase [Cryobacterium luteum]
MPVSAWFGHAPFAFWLVDAIRPRSVVELGTHLGFSYFVFCEAIARLRLASTAFALDTWEGDDHAGVYGEEVFDYVRSVNESDYAAFSTLLRGYFDDSLISIPDASVDLLHIDGRHGFEDVSHDFNAWLPKMSSRGVVIFHDIVEHQDGFGVWKFWDAIKDQYPSFSFEHSHGLGVLGVGADISSAMRDFFDAGASMPDEVRASYQRLGGEIEGLAALHVRLQKAEFLANQFSLQEDALENLRKQILDLTRSQSAAEAVVTGLNQQLLAVRASTSWRLTRPLRVVGSRLKKG